MNSVDPDKVQLVLACGHVVNAYAPSKPSSKRRCPTCAGRPNRKVMAAATDEAGG